MAVLGEVVPSGLLAPDSLLKHLRRVLAIAPHGLLVGCVVGSARVAAADGSGQALVRRLHPSTSLAGAPDDPSPL